MQIFLLQMHVDYLFNNFKLTKIFQVKVANNVESKLNFSDNFQFKIKLK